MDNFRRLLCQKASTHLPNWPKSPDSFYIAILPHDIHPTRAEGAQFLWLKAKGKSTIGKVKNIHCTRLDLEVGIEVRLVDGAKLAKEDTLIRDLDYFQSGVVVFWSVAKREHGSVPFEVPFEDVPASRQSSIESGVEVPTSDEEGRIPLLSPELLSKPQIPLSEALEHFRNTHINALFEVKNECGTPHIHCSDCPHFVSTNIYEFSRHLNSEGHRASMKKRVRLMLELYKQVRHRYGFTGLYIPLTGSNPRTPLPTMKCELCAEWEHKIVGGSDVTSLLEAAKAHLKSSAHPVKYDEKEVKEYMCRNSPGHIPNAHIRLLERLRKQHPSSDLELDLGGDSEALIHCRDCHVYIHIPSVNGADSFKTIRKMEEHFGTSRHRRLARIRVEREKKRRWREKTTRLDEMPVKRQRLPTPPRVTSELANCGASG